MIKIAVNNKVFAFNPNYIISVQYEKKSDKLILLPVNGCAYYFQNEIALEVLFEEIKSNINFFLIKTKGIKTLINIDHISYFELNKDTLSLQITCTQNDFIFCKEQVNTKQLYSQLVLAINNG